MWLTPLWFWAEHHDLTEGSVLAVIWQIQLQHPGQTFRITFPDPGDKTFPGDKRFAKIAK